MHGIEVEIHQDHASEDAYSDLTRKLVHVWRVVDLIGDMAEALADGKAKSAMLQRAAYNTSTLPSSVAHPGPPLCTPPAQTPRPSANTDDADTVQSVQHPPPPQTPRPSTVADAVDTVPYRAWSIPSSIYSHGVEEGVYPSVPRTPQPSADGDAVHRIEHRILNSIEDVSHLRDLHRLGHVAHEECVHESPLNAKMRPPTQTSRRNTLLLAFDLTHGLHLKDSSSACALSLEQVCA